MSSHQDQLLTVKPLKHLRVYMGHSVLQDLHMTVAVEVLGIYILKVSEISFFVCLFVFLNVLSQDKETSCLKEMSEIVTGTFLEKRDDHR